MTHVWNVGFTVGLYEDGGWCTAADMTADVSWLEEAEEGGKINKRVVSFVGGFS